MEEEAPRQQFMEEGAPPDGPPAVGAQEEQANRAILALDKNHLICRKHKLDDGYDELKPHLLLGNSGPVSSLLTKACTFPLCCFCCGQLQFFSVDEGCIRIGTHSSGENVFFGPGVHVRNQVWYTVEAGEGDRRVSAMHKHINGTKAIITVEQGYIGLAMDKGEAIVLPPGMHYWDDASIFFNSMVNLNSSLIKIGPYTLVTVEECYAAITQDNGKQKVLPGGNSYMLTHQNWTFQTWLSLKMQTNEFRVEGVTTGDNINLNMTVNVNWVIRDAVTAAGYNVDVNAGADQDALKMMSQDVELQVTSSLASLIGAIYYGSQNTAGLNRASMDGKVPKKERVEPRLPGQVEQDDDDVDSDAGSEPEPDPMQGHKLGRKALWDPFQMQSAVKSTNNICGRYGVQILSIKIISARPEDDKLVHIMRKGAIATVDAEVSMKEARADANSMLIAAQTEAAQAQAQADALLITAQSEAAVAQAEADAMLVKAQAAADAKAIEARADADADRTRAEGSKDAGLAIGESEVATHLAKLRIAYGPFAQNKTSTYFFGLEGPGELPTALLGKHLAAQTGTKGLALGALGIGGE